MCLLTVTMPEHGTTESTSLADGAGSKHTTLPGFGTPGVSRFLYGS